MGKGDKRTRRGKLFNRSYGKNRMKFKAKTTTKRSTPKAAPKKAAAAAAKK